MFVVVALNLLVAQPDAEAVLAILWPLVVWALRCLSSLVEFDFY